MIDKPDLPDEPEEKPKPKLKREPDRGGAGSGKPPRRTAVGAGGPDDGFNWDNIKSADINSWPIPGLTFVQVDRLPRAPVVATESPQWSQLPSEQKDPCQFPPRMYQMQDVLTGLHSQQANLAFYVHGDDSAVKYYMGISLPSLPDSDARQVHYESLKSILNSVYDDIDICRDSFDSDRIKDLISPNAIHTGIAIGTPSMESLGGQAIESRQIEFISNGLRGHRFGILVVCVPIPPKFVIREESAVLSEMERAREIADPKQKKRIKNYLELQEAYLKQLQLGTTIGSWQVGVYFFAADRAVFARLQSLIRATFTNETSRPTPLRTHEIVGLKPHIEKFGLLRNQRAERKIQSLLSYRFLTPLNSRMLSAYVHLPLR